MRCLQIVMRPASPGSVATPRRGPARLEAVGGGTEVTLEEIYAEFPEPFAVNTLRDHELHVERRSTFPDPAIVAIARLAHERGHRVALVSDTYFSAAQLDYLLDNALCGISPIVFTSSDHRVGKGNGLFDVVLDRLDVEAHRVVHAGDNEVADVERPRGLGIHAAFLVRTDAEVERLTREEGFVLDEDLDDAIAPRTFDGSAGDYGLTAVRHRVVATVDGDDALAPYRRIGAAVLGPVFAGFAEWVVREAQLLDVPRVYCLMREGAFLAPLIDRTARAMGVELDARQLWLSRHVAAKAAITTVDEATIRSFVVRRRTPTARALAEALGVAPRMLAPRAQLDIPLDDAMLTNRIVARVLSDSEIRTAVLANADAARARLDRYLATVCDPDDQELLLVDLGWNGTIQSGFDAALRALGGARRTHGRYLATTRQIVSLLLDGTRARGFLVDAGNPTGDAVAVVRSPEVLEMVTLPREGTLRDYADDGTPVLEARPVPEEQLEQEAAVREGIVAFVDHWAGCRTDDPRLALSSADRALRMILRRFVARPHPDEFALFASWHHEDNFGASGTDTLDHVDPALDLRYSAASELYRYPNEAVYWPAGVATTVAPRLAVAADLALNGHGPDVVGDHPVLRGHVELELDSPAVKSPAWADAQDLIANPESRSLVRLVTIIPEPSAIRCRIQGAVRAIRVDRVRLILHRRKAEPTVLDVDDPATHWTARRGQWQGSRLELDREEAVIELDPIHLANSDVYRTEVTLYLRLVDDEEPTQ